MTLLHLSDTHNLHRQLPQLPDADLIVHSGDFTMAGTEQEAMDFINWFCDLPYRYKIFIAGNHDDCFFGAELSGLDENCFYLCHSSIIIDGVKFYGIPMFVQNALTGTDKENIAAIPNDVDVLITHEPPYGIMDFDGRHHYGSTDLLEKIQLIKPRLHLFGHIHAAYGVKILNDITFSNAAAVGEKYRLTSNGMNLLSVS